MSVLRASGADAGDFVNGRLAWDILNATASHNRELPQTVDLRSCVMLKPYAVACLAAIGAKQKCGAELLLPDDACCAEHLIRINLPRWFRPMVLPAVEPRPTNVVADQVFDRSGDFSDQVVRSLAGELSLAVNVARDLASHLDEVVLNALTHAESPVGCVVVGQSFPGLKVMEIAILDLGQTIRGHLATNPQHRLIESDEEAVLLATTEGVTGTVGLNRWKEQNSGVGLFELRDYCERGGGELTILSGGSRVMFRVDGGPKPAHFRGRFEGCLVNIRFLPR